MSYENEIDVCNQIASAGILLDGGLRVGTIKPARCKVDGARGTKGWYWLSEFPLDDGAILITGAYGIWSGNDNGHTNIAMPEKICSSCNAVMKRTRKICPECKSSDLKNRELSKEQKAEIRKKLADRKKAGIAELKRKQTKAATAAVRQWRAFNHDGESGYLSRKQIGAHGVRFTADGAVVVPMIDTSGKIHGLQFILDKSNPAHAAKIKRMDGSDKRFWPTGMSMQGHYHLIGSPKPGDVIAVTEGYATAASLHEATGMPVIVVFNANNMLPVLKHLADHFKRNRFLICADDDYLCRCKHCKHQVLVADHPDSHPCNRSQIPCSHCNKPHDKHNTGVNVAMQSAFSIDRAEWIVPQFTDRSDPKTGKPQKLTDFNDLHVEESLQAVESQLSTAITDKFSHLGDSSASPARDAPTGGAGKADLRLMSPDDVVDRYSLIYGPKDTMFDRVLHKLIPKSCVLDNTAGRGWDDIKHHPDLRRVDIDAVGFDATERDARIVENMYTGWPTTPKQGCCDKLLELAEYLCSDDRNSRTVFKHMMRWLAYPIQHHGAKMRSALVLHGPTRVGKNLFFEAVMAIYGDYGLVIGQSELEDKFNDWASRKLFLIANEIVARQDLFHQKNKIKALVTDVTLRINPKGVASHAEKNQMNVVFLSNESQPVVPDPDDERFFVIWTPPRRDEQFYLDVVHEINHGGIAALHDHLMNIDLTGFHVGTPPPMTLAKQQLVSLSKGSVLRFFEDWRDGHLHYPFADCLKADLYDAYRRWCALEGERMPRTQTQFSMELSKYDGIKAEIKPIYAGLSAALIDRPPNDALKAKTVRLYVIESDDPIDTDMMKGRTRKIVAFKKALNTGENDDFDG